MTVHESDAADTEFEEVIGAAEQASFTGWDFSGFVGRYEESAPSWDYRTLVCDSLRSVNAVLDLGTGGGEFLASLAPLPPYAAATESYAPNVPVARETLVPLGVDVREAPDDASLPFDTARFDLVLNRHESYAPLEVRRLLRPGGTFVTQQVGGLDLQDLNVALDAPANSYADWDLAAATAGLAGAGFEISQQHEEFPPASFSDIGTLVHFLRVVSWQVPDFTVDRYRARLHTLHAQMRSGQHLTVRQHRFLIVARSPIS